MSPLPRPRSATPPAAAPTAAAFRSGRSLALRPLALRPLIAIVTAVLLLLALAGCGATFDPTGSCTADGSSPGAYPDLEAAIPTSFRSARPAQLDSGRTCTASGLGTLAARGVAELRFAGGTWATGRDSGVSLAVFIDQVGPALDPAWIAEFYEAGARTGKNVTSVDASAYPVNSSISGRRLDVLNGESFQSVVVWQRGDRIAVALVADFIRDIQTREAHDTVVREAVDALGG